MFLVKKDVATPTAPEKFTLCNNIMDVHFTDLLEVSKPQLWIGIFSWNIEGLQSISSIQKTFHEVILRQGIIEGYKDK